MKDKAVATANTTGGIRKADLFHSCDTKGQLEKLGSCMLREAVGCTSVSIYVLTGSKCCFAGDFENSAIHVICLQQPVFFTLAMGKK